MQDNYIYIVFSVFVYFIIKFLFFGRSAKLAKAGLAHKQQCWHALNCAAAALETKDNPQLRAMHIEYMQKHLQEAERIMLSCDFGKDYRDSIRYFSEGNKYKFEAERLLKGVH